MYLCTPKLKEMKQFIFLWMAVILPFCAMAQEVLTLEQCRQLAIANNKELKVASKLVDKAKEERHAARTKYFPPWESIYETAKILSLSTIVNFLPCRPLRPPCFKNFRNWDLSSRRSWKR